MKTTSLKSVLFSIIAACFTMSNAHADAYLYGDDGSTSYPVTLNSVKNDGDVYNPFSGINSIYLGNALTLENDGTPPHVNDDIVLPGYQKRTGYFKLQKSIDGTPDGAREDLVFPTKEDASNFCNDLLNAANRANAPYDPKDPNDVQRQNTTDINHHSTSIHALGGDEYKIIMVAYSIAYNTDAESVGRDGVGGAASTAQKHVFCKNQWNIQPDSASSYADENTKTGVLKGVLSADNKEYTATCMPDAKKPVKVFSSVNIAGRIYWSDASKLIRFSTNNPTTLYQLNKELGAKYCPMS